MAEALKHQEKVYVGQVEDGPFDSDRSVAERQVQPTRSVEHYPQPEVSRKIIVDAAEEQVTNIRGEYDEQFEVIQSTESGATKVAQLKSFFHRTVSFAEVTEDKVDMERVGNSYHMLVKELGGGARDLRMSDETCVYARLHGEYAKIEETIRILKETFADNNMDSEEYAGRYAFAIEQLARSGRYERAMNEMRILDNDMYGMVGLRPNESDSGYEPASTPEIAEARARVDSARLYLWQKGLDEEGHGLPSLEDTFKTYDSEAFRRLAFKLAYNAPEEVAQRAKWYVEDKYYRDRDELTAAEHRVDAFIESGSLDAYHEALGSVADLPLPAANKAQLLVKMSLEGGEAFNRMGFEDRDNYAGTAQLILDSLENELAQHGWPEKPLNPKQLEQAVGEIKDKNRNRKIGTLLSRAFVLPVRREALDDAYYEEARHLHHKLNLEVAFVTGQPEDMSQADRSYDLYGGPRSALDSESHIRNLEYSIRQIEVLAQQGEVFRALRLAQVDNLTSTHEAAQEIYVPVIAGAMLRCSEGEYAQRLLRRLAFSQERTQQLQASDVAAQNYRQLLLRSLVDYTDITYIRSHRV